MQRPFPAAGRLIAAIALAAVLGACDTLPKRESIGYADLFGNAEAEVTAGRTEAALVAFDQAAKADPMSKEPWVRTAQLHFDAGNYGRAIVAAEEVLQRDPADKVADSVLTVSGLRIAAESLQRLQGNGALASESARTEAERLAATMRATMGEEILAGSPAKPRSTPRRRAAPAPAADKPAAPKASGSGIANPFGGLGS